MKHRDLNAALRREQAMKLRAGKMHWRDIANLCGYASPGAAYNAVWRDGMDKREAKNIEQMRKEEGEMLDELHRAIWMYAVGNPNIEITGDEDEDELKAKRKEKKPGLFAADRILEISKARRDLWGMNKPKDEAPMAGKVIIRAYPSEWVSALPALGAPTDPLASLPATTEEVKP